MVDDGDVKSEDALEFFKVLGVGNPGRLAIPASEAGGADEAVGPGAFDAPKLYTVRTQALKQMGRHPEFTLSCHVLPFPPHRPNGRLSSFLVCLWYLGRDLGWECVCQKSKLLRNYTQEEIADEIFWWLVAGE